MTSGAQPVSEPPSLPPSRPQRVMFGSWKRAVLFGLAFGAGIVIALAIIGVAVWEYQNRTTTVHTWESIQLTQIGVKASLKTQARDGLVRYQFSVSPLSADLEDAFDHVANTVDTTKAFSAILYDSDGFERCRGELNNITKTVGTYGKVVALEGNGYIFGCSVEEYVDAQNWNLSYQFPDLKTWTAPNSDALARKNGGVVLDPWERYAVTSPKHARKQVEDTEGDDVLTGTSYDGNLETESGHTFHVTRQGEIGTTWRWLAAEHIHYECKAGICLVY
jgi:hypothetical protein